VLRLPPLNGLSFFGCSAPQLSVLSRRRFLLQPILSRHRVDDPLFDPFPFRRAVPTNQPLTPLAPRLLIETRRNFAAGCPFHLRSHLPPAPLSRSVTSKIPRPPRILHPPQVSVHLHSLVALLPCGFAPALHVPAPSFFDASTFDDIALSVEMKDNEMSPLDPRRCFSCYAPRSYQRRTTLSVPSSLVVLSFFFSVCAG